MNKIEKDFFEVAIKFYDNISTYSENDVELNIQIKQESSIVKRINSELEWQILADNEKQSSRRSMIIILSKWSYEEGRQDSLFYENNLVDLYDNIENIFTLEFPDAPLFFRLKSILAIEKYFINEKKEFNLLRHMDYYIWTKLFATLRSEHADLYETMGLNKLNSIFIAMYSNWPKRPYKEV